MSLTALTSSNGLYNPSLILEVTKDRDTVVRNARIMQKAYGFSCPHCFALTGERLPVYIRNASDRRIHFVHEKSLKGGQKCTNHRNMSERHLNAQSAIQHYYTTKFPTCTIKLEVRLQSHPKLTFNRPDVLILYPNGVQEVHEVQLSPMTGEELLARTASLKANGAGNVVWYLGDKGHSTETVNSCLKSAITVNKLSFTDDDMPSWEPITKFIKQHPSKQPTESTCSYTSKTQNNVIPINSRSPQQSQPPTSPAPKEVKNPYSDRQKYRHKTLGFDAYFVETPWGMEGITVQVFIPDQDRITVLPLRMLEIDTPMGWATVEVKS
jgi:competence CoiA-like predicted nuclease